jgi:hypothetical protein
MQISDAAKLNSCSSLVVEACSETPGMRSPAL